MPLLSPSVQSETEGLQSETGTPPVVEPSLSGPAPALWAGFAAFVIVFIVVLMLIIRGRVIRPAARKTAAPTDFFEPAGEEAEITFDDQAPAEQTQQPVAEAPEPQKKSQRSPFASLFAKKPKEEPEAPLEEDETYDMLAGETEEGLFEHVPADNTDTYQPEPEAETRPAGPKQLKPMNDDVEARRREAEQKELERLEALEEASEQARRREKPAAAAAAALAAFPRADRDAADTAQHYEKMQQALETTLTERFDALSQDIHSRLGALMEQVESKAHTMQELASPDSHGVSEAHFAELANLIGEQLETLRDSTTTSVEALSRRLDKLDNDPDGAVALSKHIAQLNQTLGRKTAASTAGRLQLTDILANALPPGRYALGRKLANNKTVDALIDIAGAKAPVAIDARFPVEAFDEYERRRLDSSNVEAAETEFRRLMFRHIVDIAEKQIAPEETADCALMFVPSEHILTMLYASFSDIVQESYRARIWIVSPASLTASLYTISAIMKAPVETDSAAHTENMQTAQINGAHENEAPEELATTTEPSAPSPHEREHEEMLPDTSKQNPEPLTPESAPHFPLR